MCTLVPAALETTAAHTAMPLVHSIVGSVGHTVVGCTAPHRSVVVGPCFAALLSKRFCHVVHSYTTISCHVM